MTWHWLLIAIAAFMAIANLLRARQNPSSLFRGLAWAYVTGYFVFTLPWLLYLGIVFLVIGFFIPPNKRPAQEEPAPAPLTMEPDTRDAEEAQDTPYPSIPSPPPLPSTAVAREIEVPLTLEDEQSFPTSDGRTLTLAAGTHTVLVRLREQYHDPGTDDCPIDTLAITHRLADAGGHIWQAEVPIATTPITEAFSDRLARLDNREQVVMHCEETAPAVWREAVTQRALLAGLRDRMDDRRAYDITVDDRLLIVHSKYQLPHYDLAWLPNASSFLVRVTRLSDQQHPDVETEDDAMLLLPPLYFLLAPAELLLQTTETCTDADGSAHDEEEEPCTITFHPTDQHAAPNPGVTIGG